MNYKVGNFVIIIKDNPWDAHLCMGDLVEIKKLTKSSCIISVKAVRSSHPNFSSYGHLTWTVDYREHCISAKGLTKVEKVIYGVS